VAAGRIAFERQVAQEVTALFARSQGGTPAVLTEAELVGLPEPVQRWLPRSQVIGKERPVSIRLQQEGLFSRDGQTWMPYMAEQYYTTDPPGFVWAATMQMAPGLSLIGRDRYFEGRGNMTWRLLGLLPVVDARGPELDQGAMLRYLNETMWFPAAAVSPYINWDTVDLNAARATMSYGGVTVSATFYFDDNGDLVNMVAQRYRDIGGQYSLDTWSTPVSAYREFNGVRMPTEGRGVWNLSSGDLPYIKPRVTGIEYNRLARY